MNESYGGVFLYNQPEVIMEQYDLEVGKITKGRGAYICETDQGMKLLKEFRGSEERAEFLAVILARFLGSGFEVEQIFRDKEGKALVTEDTGDRFILKDMIRGTECSTKNRDEMKAAMRLLARFHTVSASLGQEIPEFMKNGENELAQLYAKHNRELVKVKNYVRSKRKKNEFEMKFQEQYAHFIENAQKTLEKLVDSDLPEECRMLCHGDCNQHNIVYTENGWRMIHFEYMGYHAAVQDIANFMRKMLEKNGWNSRLGEELITAYESERMLQEEERRQLCLALAYPEKFWKLANHYYNSHKAWLSGRNIEKLDKVIEQEEERMRFLQNLFSFHG